MPRDRVFAAFCRIGVLACSLFAACSSSAGGSTDRTSHDASSEPTGRLDADLADSSSKDPGTDSGSREPIAGRVGFQVSGIPALVPSSGVTPCEVPDMLSFTLWIDVAAQAMTTGTPGFAYRTALTSLDGRTFVTTERAYLQYKYARPSFSCTVYVVLDSFQFEATATELEGSASGEVQFFSSEGNEWYTADLSFTGTLDQQGPELSFSGRPRPDGLDPISFLRLIPSEPLPDLTSARLVTGAESIDLVPIVDFGVTTSFTKPDGVVLRYGTAYTVVVEPWRDLAGNAGHTIAELATSGLPMRIVEDGFESRM